jgi:poly(A) polymerase
VIAKLAAAGLKSVPTGLKHGTVTAIADGRPFEVTTLRRDVETYGRHADVAFTDNWTEDAARRDLTINSVYCDPDGTLYDPFSGLGDIRSGHIRFVGEARARIEEDVLRILRFFRFFAHYGQGEIDAEGLAACQDLAHLLPGLSAERVSAEILRLLVATDPLPTVCLMDEAGVWLQLLPGEININSLQNLVQIERAEAVAEPLRRIFALDQPDVSEAFELARHYRLSNVQRTRLVAMAISAPDLVPGMADQALRRLLYAAGPEAVMDRVFLNEAQFGGENWSVLRSRVADWEPQTLPVQGRDVLALGIAPGPEVGDLIVELEAWWVENDFRPDRAACLDQLQKLISQT